MAFKQPPPPENAFSLAPSSVRQHLRENKYYGGTAGFCQGYVQANLVVVPEDLADLFEEFCARNSGPLPLLFRSQPGEVGAPLLAKESDVRTDLPRYLIFSNGRQVEDMMDLHGFEWNRMVSFYLGCSYSFEDALVASGVPLRHLQEKKSVSMFTSSIQCYKVQDMVNDCFMIVSMRPIHKDQIQKAFEITSHHPKSHGAPIHIGNPARIGISNLAQPDLGDTMEIKENEVAVFWACGCTGQKALESLKPKLGFTHFPGCMFITDILSTSMEVAPRGPAEEPTVVPISPPRSPFFASVTSSKVLTRMTKIERIILEDLGNRGITEILEEGDFAKAAIALSHAQSIAVVTGFPCNSPHKELEETDGLPGALAIAQALQAMGKTAVIVMEERCRELVESSISKLLSWGALCSAIRFVSCSQLLESECSKQFDCLLAIERSGRAADGTYRTSNARDISSLLDHVDDVFVRALDDPSVTTVAIGDGGNELGMGKVLEKVKMHVPRGPDIACSVASDFLITTGVSNWGGYGLALSLYLLSSCPVHWRYKQHGINAECPGQWKLEQFLPTNQQTQLLLEHLNDLGVRDGINGSLDQSVDGLPLETHLKKMDELRAVVLKSD